MFCLSKHRGKELSMSQQSLAVMSTQPAGAVVQLHSRSGKHMNWWDIPRILYSLRYILQCAMTMFTRSAMTRSVKCSSVYVTCCILPYRGSICSHSWTSVLLFMTSSTEAALFDLPQPWFSTWSMIVAQMLFKIFTLWSQLECTISSGTDAWAQLNLARLEVRSNTAMPSN